MILPHRIARLAKLAELQERRVLGLMSGTSMDGLDLALCQMRGRGGNTLIELERFRTVPYSSLDRESLLGVVSRPEISLRDLTVLHSRLAALHAGAVRESLEQWGISHQSVHLLASHGHTVYHAPSSWQEDGEARHATLQIGDGDQLAVRTGILTLSDFRQKEIAAGGQGAPMAPYAEAMMFAGESPRVLLNLGGIANFSWLPARGSGEPVRFGDTGPANGLIDRAVRRLLPGHPQPFDRDGELAARGAPHHRLLEELKAEPYFQLPCPKSTGPETFGDAYLDPALKIAEALGLAAVDIIATLTRLTVETIAETLRREVPSLEGAELLVNGGGRHNPSITGGLRELLPELRWLDADALGIPPDAREAVLFALLAHESLFGEGFAPLAGCGGKALIGFGKLSWPD